MTTFKQVSAKENPPKESGSYLTYLGYKWYDIKTKCWTDFCPSGENDNQERIVLQYWLKLITTLPTDEQIEKSIQSEKSGGHEKTMSQNYIDSKIDGAKWMRDVLAGEAVNPLLIQIQ